MRAFDLNERARLQSEIAQMKLQLNRRDTKPHFVAEYNEFVQQLIRDHPIDEAMSYAVGGSYDTAGPHLVAALERCGLKEGMSVLDLGCGSGRLAKYLGKSYNNLEYLGIDVVQELLDYAALQSPPNFKFVLNHDLKLPAPDKSVDLVAIFSVFTHLLHQESYVYLEEARRVLRPDGRVAFTFLESRSNWPIFSDMVSRARAGGRDDQLNMFMERPQVEAWAEHLGMTVLGYDFGLPHKGDGQTLVVLSMNG